MIVCTNLQWVRVCVSATHVRVSQSVCFFPLFSSTFLFCVFLYTPTIDIFAQHVWWDVFFKRCDYCSVHRVSNINMQFVQRYGARW